MYANLVLNNIKTYNGNYTASLGALHANPLFTYALIKKILTLLF